MKHKFEVRFETEYCHNHHLDCYHLNLLDVIPKSLSFSCPHCQVYSVMKLDTAVKRFNLDEYEIIARATENLLFDFICSCPNCKSTIFVQAMAQINVTDDTEIDENSGGQIIAIYPYRKNFPIASEVPEKYANDFSEAQIVLDLSPKASAALSRRILQNVIREEFKIRHRDLAKEIDDFIALPGLPSYLTDAVDAIRNIGNFAAHPLKNTSTGEVVDVEPGEAEWLIEVLNSLFDFKFIQPKRLEERKNKLNEKLKGMGKPEMK